MQAVCVVSADSNKAEQGQLALVCQPELNFTANKMPA